MLLATGAAALRAPAESGGNTWGWRFFALHRAIKDSQYQKLMAGKGELYEFGVFRGDSLKTLHTVFGKETRMWGFDSFKGLPEAEGDVKQKDWHTGRFKVNEISVQASLQDRYGDKLGLVAGFYNESLTKTLKSERHMKPAEYIDVDCDLFVSSYQALDWVFGQGIAVPGTLVGYDDWWLNPCSVGGEKLHPHETGEGKAHVLISQKYGVRFRCVAGACQPPVEGKEIFPEMWGPVFVVEEVGAKPEHGFHWSADQVAYFKEHAPMCVGTRGNANVAVSNSA